jgi:hypothetical protein
MDKHIRAVFLLNKAVAFALIKPLDNSISHRDTLLTKKFYGSKLQVATFEKWTFPSERNRPPKKTDLY